VIFRRRRPPGDGGQVDAYLASMVGRAEGMATGFDDFPRESEEDYGLLIERASAVARVWRDAATVAHQRHAESGDETLDALAQRADDAEAEWRRRADDLANERRERFGS
jgi:hypothetical protein